MSTKHFQAVKGMNDVLPTQTSAWRLIEKTMQDIVQRYGYQEIRFPIVEPAALFERTLGKITDIVEKEMYIFDDFGDRLCLRPEGTGGCVRAAIENGLLHHQIQRLWYSGPMFRHEKPQKGRYRQFHQFGIEAFGMPGPDIDAEQIVLSARIFKELNIENQVTLQLNSLGSLQSRIVHREQLIKYFLAHQAQLDADSQRRLQTNPLRILDSKNPDLQSLIQAAPRLIDFLDDASKAHFSELCELLTLSGIQYKINPQLVRGLDYYGLTVYEWVTTDERAQNTVCAGGRYDDLVEQLGGSPTPAVGFALGMERVLALLPTVSAAPTIDAYVVVTRSTEGFALTISEKLRQALPHLRLLMHCGSGNFKHQFKRADKSGAKWAFIIGESEAQAQKISVKNLRIEQPQQQWTLSELIEFLRGNR